MEDNKLERGLGLKEASALNMIDMVGIGPFIVIPIVIQEMNGPQCMLAWIAGAMLAAIDGFIWAELGAAMPKAGGSYFFLKEIYGKETWGKLMSFLFIWQTIIQAPLVVASGSIGFSQYLTYLIPLSPIMQKAVSGLLVLILIFLLYRKITTVGKISLFLWIGVFGTIVWLIVGGVTHFNPKLAFDFPKEAFNFSWLFFAGLGNATVKTIYTYLGYYNVCHLGAEIKEPEVNIPRSIF
ncbi:MAG: amino acid permease, partial [Ignavibacteriaceae bacterium]|nr:amino acid permease [Ignavibacteriaceae bacterium]